MELESFCQMCDILKISGKCNEKYIQRLMKKSCFRNDEWTDYRIQKVLYDRFYEIYERDDLNLSFKKDSDQFYEMYSIIEYFIKCRNEQKCFFDLRYKTWIMDVEIKQNKFNQYI